MECVAGCFGAHVATPEVEIFLFSFHMSRGEMLPHCFCKYLPVTTNPPPHAVSVSKHPGLPTKTNHTDSAQDKSSPVSNSGTWAAGKAWRAE